MQEEPSPKCAACNDPEEEKQREAFVDQLIAEHKSRPGALIPILQAAQQEIGYLSEATLKRVGEKLGEPLSKIFGVVTFYSFFSRVPRGKYLIRICLGTACYVRGAEKILDAFKKELEIDVYQTTPDRMFSLDVARCFGACGLAPAVMINDKVHQRVKPSQVKQILAACRKKESPVRA